MMVAVRLLLLLLLLLLRLLLLLLLPALPMKLIWLTWGKTMPVEAAAYASMSRRLAPTPSFQDFPLLAKRTVVAVSGSAPHHEGEDGRTC